MGERAKVILNEYSARELLKRDTLNLDKFYTADLKLFVEVARKEIERLNNNINKGIEAINVYQNEKTLSVSYQDLKRIRGILKGNKFDLQMFEEYLQELEGDSSNDNNGSI